MKVWPYTQSDYNAVAPTTTKAPLIAPTGPEPFDPNVSFAEQQEGNSGGDVRWIRPCLALVALILVVWGVAKLLVPGAGA